MKKLGIVILMAIMISLPSCNHPTPTIKDEPGDKGMMSNLSVRYPSNIFVEGEKVKLYHIDVGEPLKWSLKDWKGNIVKSGEWKDIKGPLLFDDIDFGYYIIEIYPLSKPEDLKKIYFSYIRDLSKITASSEVVYSLDTAQSIFSVSNKLLTDLSILAGAGMIRDRMIWSNITLDGEKTNWGKFGETADLYKNTPVKIINCMHMAPDSAKAPLKDLPHDLQALYEFTKEMASHFADSYSAVEFWNEIDLVEFCRDPAWDYAAAQKAAYLGLKAGNPNLDVLVSSMTHNVGPVYNDIVFANDIGAHFDIFNFHTYSFPYDYNKDFLIKIDLLNKWNISARPFWITEFGMSRPEAKGTGDVTVSGKPEHDSAQEILHAEFLVKGNITLQSFGSAMNFFFILPPHKAPKDMVYGLLRHDLTIKPGYTAQTALVSMLGGKTYMGKAVLKEDVLAYLYEDKNGEQTLVYWGDDTIDLGDKSIDLKVYDMMGASVTNEEKGKLKATNSPQYAVGVKGIKVEETNLLNQLKSKDERKVDKDIVLRVELGDSFGVINRVNAKSKVGKTVDFKLDVFNFSSVEKKVTLKDYSENCKLTFGQKEVTIPSMGKVQVDAQVIMDQNGPMQIGGDTNEGEVARVYIPLLG